MSGVALMGSGDRFACGGGGDGDWGSWWECGRCEGRGNEGWGGSMAGHDDDVVVAVWGEGEGEEGSTAGMGGGVWEHPRAGRSLR